jgi:ATP-dependent DNA helicase DinG
VDIDKLFERGSPLFKDFPRYEERKEQKELARMVKDSFEKGHVSLLEAGTGVGKSFAYLVPALLLAHVKGEKVVISTHTIHLQEQIVKKDLPFLLKALEFNLGFSLAMGLRNYLCLRNLDDWGGEEEKELKDKVSAWKELGGSLKKGEIPFYIPPDLAETLFADHDSCTGQRCAFYDDCPVFADRKKLEDAKIIVVNHHLLLTDAVRKKGGERAILPNYSYLIIDEAHHLEEVATDLFANSVSNIDLFRLFGRLYTEAKRGRKGVLNRLLEKVETYFSKQNEPSFLRRFREKILMEFPALREKGMMEIHRLYQGLVGASPSLDPKWRLTNTLKISFKKDIHPLLKRAEESNQMLPAYLSGLLQDVRDTKEEKLVKDLEPLFQEIDQLRGRFQEGLILLREILGNEEVPKGLVQWFSAERDYLNLSETSIDQSKTLKEVLFSPLKGGALLSATLGGKGGFAPLAERLGLKERGWEEASFPSPFNFQRQALFLGVEGLSLPDDPQFTMEAKELLLDLLPTLKGGTFLLFTSFQQLNALKVELEEKLKEKRMVPLFQGDLPRRKLLERFQDEHRTVLFGTDSFWEGVDIPGGKLKTVILMKLPFKSPKDPIIEARSESLKEEGKNPFMSYHLPQALIKFKQGFGRLIRSHSDKGIVLCLDRRLQEKSYGKLFLATLPSCEKKFIAKDSIKTEITKFFALSKPDGY